jgi:hypothetical protein
MNVFDQLAAAVQESGFLFPQLFISPDILSQHQKEMPNIEPVRVERDSDDDWPADALFSFNGCYVFLDPEAKTPIRCESSGYKKKE